MDIWFTVRQINDASLLLDNDQVREAPLLDRLRIHVIAEAETSTSDLRTAVELMRQLRVGSAAHNPQIVCWLGTHSVTDVVTNSLAQLDASVPRIRVILVSQPSIAPAAWQRASLLCARASLDTTLLFVGDQEERFALSPARSHVDENVRVFYECYPSPGQCHHAQRSRALVDHLMTISYAFPQHPLFLCGTVAQFVKRCWLTLLGVPVERMRNLCAPVTLLRLSLLEGIPCSKEAIRRVVPAIGDRICSCPSTTSLSSLRIDTDDAEAFRSMLHRVRAPILLDGWQYIHDGFA